MGGIDILKEQIRLLDVTKMLENYRDLLQFCWQG